MRLGLGQRLLASRTAGEVFAQSLRFRLVQEAVQIIQQAFRAFRAG